MLIKQWQTWLQRWGNGPVNHGAANTLPFEEAVSYVRGAGAGVTREGERLGRRVGGMIPLPPTTVIDLFIFSHRLLN